MSKLWQEGIGKLAAVYVISLFGSGSFLAVLQRHQAAAGQLGPVRSASDIRSELQQAAPEPLLPVEKKLIGFSLGTGLVLVVVLALLNQFVPATF